jgi:excisionase family DNA binding protein
MPRASKAAESESPSTDIDGPGLPSKMTTPPLPLLTIVEAAEFLHLSVGGLYHLVSQRRVPVVRISSRCIRFSRLDLEKWIANHSHPSRDSHPVGRAVAEGSGGRAK